MSISQGVINNLNTLEHRMNAIILPNLDFVGNGAEYQERRAALEGKISTLQTRIQNVVNDIGVFVSEIENRTEECVQDDAHKLLAITSRCFAIQPAIQELNRECEDLRDVILRDNSRQVLLERRV